MTKKTLLPAPLKTTVADSKIKDLLKAEKIAANYAPFMNEVTNEMQKLKKLKKGNADDVEISKEIRIALSKICARASEQKKDDKKMLLIETRFIDALFNTVNNAARLTQEESKEIELYFLKIEEAKYNSLMEQRILVLSPFFDSDELIPDFIGNMDDSLFDSFLLGVKADFAKKEADKKEAERVELKQLETNRRNKLITPLLYTLSEKERISYNDISTDAFDVLYNKSLLTHKSEQEKLIEENNKLKAEREIQIHIEKVKEAKLKADRVKQIAKEKEAAAKLEAEKKKQIEIEKAAAAKLEAERKEADILLSIERAKLLTEKLAKEKLQSKIDSANKVIQEISDKHTDKSNKSDADKFKDIIADFNLISSGYTFDDVKYAAIFSNVVKLNDKIISYINSKI